MIIRLFRGNIIALIGLFLGLSTGAGLLLAKQWIIREVVSALEDEVVASCDCSLAFDSLSLSFLTLRAHARNVRIVEQGLPKLAFKSIVANVDISEIRDKRIHLSSLTLRDGTADGIGPKSVAFRFIDQLTTPLPPEKQRPNRWRVILDNLKVENSFIREPFSSSEISGSGVSLTVKREGENFLLAPRIGDLRYVSFGKTPKTPPKELLLGPLTATVLIEDSKTIFQSLKLMRASSLIEMSGSALNNEDQTFSGIGDFRISSDYIGLPSWLVGIFSGSSTISGSLGSPVFTGSLQNSTSLPLTIALPNASIVEIPEISASLSIDINRGNPTVTLPTIQGQGKDLLLTSTQPLTLTDAGLAAGFKVSLPDFSYGPFSIRNSTATITISEESEGIHTKISIQAADLLTQGLSLGPGSIQIQLSPTQVTMDVRTTDPRQGTLTWVGDIDLSTPTPTLSSGTLTLRNYRYPLSLPVSRERLSPVAITTQSTLKGPLNLSSLTGEGTIALTFPSLQPDYSFTGQASLSNGTLKMTLPKSPYMGRLDIDIDFVKSLEGKIQFTQPPTLLANLLGHEDDCSKIGGALLYTFSLSRILDGSGEIVTPTLSLGCAPYSLALPPTSRIPIQKGALLLKNIVMETSDSTLALDGEIHLSKGYAMSAKGQLELSALLPLLPSIDDLRGVLKTDISIRGSLTTPSIAGTAELRKGQFGTAVPEIEGHNISGAFSLTGKELKISKLSGSVNGGTFSTTGTFSPFDPSISSLTIELRGVTIEPVADATITFSSDLTLGLSSNQKQTLEGIVNITFAEIAKDFDVNKLIMSTISGYFLPSRIQPAATRQKIDLDLNVQIAAPRNIFIVTPFLSAELNSSLLARGNISAPAIEGSMQILSGWIGLKGNRFDITSGGLSFKPTSLIPDLEIVSEGNLRAPTGENVLVILDASGPLSNPKLSLNSDRGLSQSDLLLILTSSRPLGDSSMKSRMDSQFGSGQRFFMSDTSFSSFKAFFRSLTRLDVLSFEPAYNQFTGTIEPAIVARKNVTPRLTLVGESLFSSVSNSRAGGIYSLTPYLDLNAFFQTVSTQKNSILSSDLTYTIWSEQSQFVSIDIDGLSHFSESSILNASRLGPSSRIANTPESLELIRHHIVSYMNDNGFIEASAQVNCVSGDSFCSKLAITVNEGRPFLISAITFEGDALGDKRNKLALATIKMDSLATTSSLASIEQALVLSLRNDGYIAARITPTYRHSRAHATSTLVITSELRRPISFTFTGNKIFSSKDFLNSIDLFTRKRPFGNNTISLLIQNIERMYHEKGFLYSKVSYREDRSDTNRIIYRISITEEMPTTIKAFSFHGNRAVTKERLIQAMNEMGMKEQIAAFDAQFAVPDNLEALRDSIISVYHHEGFPDAAVSYTIHQVENAKLVEVTFDIQEGQPQLCQSLTLSGYPVEVVQSPSPPHLLSLPRINIYSDQIIESLKAEGFLLPTIFTIPSPDYASIELVVEPGPRTIISEITYEGLLSIPERTAIQATRLQSGTPYRADDVHKTKKELLRTGLFSRVEIVASDGTFDSEHEAITVRIVERPLQTLELGIGANSEFGVHTFGEATNKSLFADGRYLALRVDTYFDQAQINPSGSGLISQGFTSLRYVDPSLFGSDYSLNEEIRYQRQELSTQEFNIDRLLLGSYLFRQVQSDMAMSFGHSLVFDNLQDVTPGAILSDLDDGSVRLSFISGVLKYDKRDDPLLPSSGHTLTLEPKVAFSGIGSQANFASLAARTTSIIPLSGPASRYSLGFGLSGAIAQPWGSTEEIPITQRFYLGGRTTVRGFRENSLGPRGADGAVLGGDSMLAAKAQFQYLADDSIRTHIFFDAGNVFLRHTDFDLRDLRTSVGVGFQYLSPIGPIGFDVGRPLDEKPGEPSVRIHFSVGSSF